MIPALLEAGNLARLLDRVRAVLATAHIDWEVIVVDDYSGDGTEEIVSAIARQDPRIRLLIRRGERGLSGAILHGWRHTDATILGAMDADGQHPPELLPRLIAAMAAGRDLAMGSRTMNGGPCGLNGVRRFISRVAILMALPLLPFSTPVRDPLSGFFLVRRESVQNCTFQAAGFKLLLEILVRGRIADIEEIPFIFGRRSAGRSKMNARAAWDYLRLMARLFRAKRSRAGGATVQATAGGAEEIPARP